MSPQPCKVLCSDRTRYGHIIQITSDVNEDWAAIKFAGDPTIFLCAINRVHAFDTYLEWERERDGLD